ncbi:MAG: complex I NDUFA9 subunit family protein [Pseudomonadota bacterium]
MNAMVVTIFGGTGFIGRHLIGRLAQTGAAIRVVTRKPSSVLSLRPMGEVGQIVPLEWDGQETTQLDHLVGDVDCVINLVGILAERRQGDFRHLQAELPGKLAAIAASNGVSNFVQISAIGADANSASVYARTKAEGEKAALESFPTAVVLRPSIVFGAGDGFFARFANMSRYSPALPLIAGGQTRFQPVYVGDVAEALLKATLGLPAGGQTYELGGPKIYTFKELLRYILEVTRRRRLLVSLPMAIARLQARFAERLPNPPLTRDQLLLLEIDNVTSENALGLSDLEIRPTPLELIVPQFLQPYAQRSVKAPVA